MLLKTGKTKENCKSERLPPKKSPVAHVGGAAGPPHPQAWVAIVSPW